MSERSGRDDVSAPRADESRAEREPGAPQEVPPNDHVSMSAERAYYLQRTEVLSDLKKDVEGWAKKRFWILTVIIVVVGFFGIKGFVRDLFAPLLRDAERMQLVMQLASEGAKQASEEVRRSAAEQKKALEVITEQAQKLRSQLLALDEAIIENAARAVTRDEANVDRAMAAARLESNRLSAHIEQLEALFRETVAEPQRGEAALQDYERNVVELKQVADKTKQVFNDNSDFSVVVHVYRNNTDTNDIASAIIRNTAKAGFKSQDSKFLRSFLGKSSEGMDIRFHPKARAKALIVENIVRASYLELGMEVPQINMRSFSLAVSRKIVDVVP